MKNLSLQEMEFVFQAVANTQITAKDSAFVSSVLEKIGTEYNKLVESQPKSESDGDSKKAKA